jgi:hypothetical protein
MIYMPVPMIYKVEAEEAVLNAPTFDEGFAPLEESGEPTVTDMGIKGPMEVVDHPEDGLAALGLTKEIALGGMMHLFDSQSAGIDKRLEEVERIRPTGIHHLHGRQDEVHRVVRIIRVKGRICQVFFDHLNV